MFKEGEVVGTLKLEQNLGMGAFGTVFLATEVMLNRRCAVKFIKSDNPNEFKEHLEGQILEKCKHENVVEVYDVNVHQKDGNFYAAIEMEYMPNGSLESYLSKKFVSPKECIKIVIDILFALEHAHVSGVLHRDIKPANIMIGLDNAKLADFGIAASVDETKTGSVAGTPVFRAPETFAVDGQCSISTEIFSVGMTLFQVLSNLTVWPLTQNDLPHVLAGQTIKRVGYPSYLPRKLRMICNTACHQNPDKRYSTAKKMRQALEALQIKIDWRKIDESNWEGFDKKGRIHTLEITKKHDLLYKIDGRQRKDDCKKFQNMNAAKAHAADFIYRSTF